MQLQYMDGLNTNFVNLNVEWVDKVLFFEYNAIKR